MSSPPERPKPPHIPQQPPSPSRLSYIRQHGTASDAERRVKDYLNRLLTEYQRLGLEIDREQMRQALIRIVNERLAT